MKIFFFLIIGIISCFGKEYTTRFVIITPSYNNSLYCEKNIHSLIRQQYPHFRIIYIDDASTDDTATKISAYINLANEKPPITFIKNTTRRGALANFYTAIHTCADDEVIVVVDGDDYLPHPHVLSKLGSVYADPDTWLTYGDFICYPSYQQDLKICHPFPDKIVTSNQFRWYPWTSSHLRTFYAGLFKQIKLEDLLYQGEFFSMAGDVAAMIPMLEMAGKRHRYISDILYVYNTANPISDGYVNRSLQFNCEYLIRSFAPYHPIDSYIRKPIGETELVVFSFDRPMQLYALLESAQKYLHNLEKITVLYRTSSKEYQDGYDLLQKDFRTVYFVKQGAEPHNDFKPLLMSILNKTSANYVLFAVDDIIFIDHVDIKKCAETLETTNAYGYYLAHSSNLDFCYMLNMDQGIPPHLTIGQDTYMWQFESGKGDWAYPHSLDFALYRKGTVINALSHLYFSNPNSMEYLWSCAADLKKYGLFDTSAKAVNIPLNLVNISTNRCMHSLSAETLLHAFQEGYKIDIDPLFQIPHRSRHMEYEPKFISR